MHEAWTGAPQVLRKSASSVQGISVLYNLIRGHKYIHKLLLELINLKALNE